MHIELAIDLQVIQPAALGYFLILFFILLILRIQYTERAHHCTPAAYVRTVSSCLTHINLYQSISRCDQFQ